jgi:hypothetical protein
MRAGAKGLNRGPNEPAATSTIAEGASYLIEDVAGPLVRLTIDTGNGVIVHTGTRAAIRARAIDAGIDAAEIRGHIP